MKINRLEHTKKLYPHFFDKRDDSNFTKHLKIVGEVQKDLRHKLKTVEWGRILEKPLQLWKEQDKPYVYTMHFKSYVPFLKEFNVYKNPVIDDEENIVGYEKVENSEDEKGRLIHKTFTYEENVKFYEETVNDIETTKYVHHITDDGEEVYHNRIIPNDTFVLEVITWDDYRFLKGFPENDYTVKEDNILQYRYNETFLSIKLEEISYSKYLTFKVHKDNIKEILIRKNEKPFYKQVFVLDLIDTTKSLTDLSYTYFDKSITNERTYGQGDYLDYYEVEEGNTNYKKIYFADTEKDEYVFRLPLSDEDFDENGIIKDTYDLEVTTFEKRYHCLHSFDRVYSKRYNGYDNQLNDCFDHDYSLDIIGALLNVPRLRFYQVYKKNIYYLSRTYPSYNNRVTEDDYHYMRRIQYYISNYNHIVFPVLEFWKWYQTNATIHSRKRIIGEMDYSYLRTLNDDIVIGDMCDDDLIEEFDDKKIISYSINKATNTNGEITTPIIRGNTIWYEDVIVDNLFIVPSIDYRLRFGVKSEDNVTIRMICYNNKNVEIRTTPIKTEKYIIDEDSIEENHPYNTDETYTYIDTKINIPSDTTSIKLILESNNSFSYKDVTFERITVSNFNNDYMVTDTNYNSNVYELYAIYEEIPSNIRIGGTERFNILFKRSLPLTKRGFFLMDMNERSTTNLGVSTQTELKLKNILNTHSFQIDGNPYVETVNDFINGLYEYKLQYTFKISENDVEYDEQTNLPIIPLDTVLVTSITFYNEDDEIDEVTFDNVYSDTETNITHTFTTPPETTKITITINNETPTQLQNMRLSRTEELIENEVTNK